MIFQNKISRIANQYSDRASPSDRVTVTSTVQEVLHHLVQLVLPQQPDLLAHQRMGEGIHQISSRRGDVGKDIHALIDLSRKTRLRTN